MTVLKRELAYKVSGHVGKDEDWWSLNYDTQTKILSVEHQWVHNELLTSDTPRTGKEQIDIAAYLKQPAPGTGQRELERAIVSMFVGIPIANDEAEAAALAAAEEVQRTAQSKVDPELAPEVEPEDELAISARGRAAGRRRPGSRGSPRPPARPR